MNGTFVAMHSVLTRNLNHQEPSGWGSTVLLRLTGRLWSLS